MCLWVERRGHVKRMGRGLAVNLPVDVSFNSTTMVHVHVYIVQCMVGGVCGEDQSGWSLWR